MCDLHISSEAEYRLYTELRRMTNDTLINESDIEAGFKYKDCIITMENGSILVIKNRKVINKISIETFMRKPRETMKILERNRFVDRERDK